MTAEQDKISAEGVFRVTLAYLTMKYPSHDCIFLLPQLVREGIISLFESALVKIEPTPDDRNSRLFLQILPPKSTINIKKSFDVMRCNFQKEESFLHGQQNILEGQWIKRIKQNLAETTAAFYQRLESQAETQSQSGVHNKALSDLMGILVDIKKGQTQMAVSVEKLLCNLAVDASASSLQNILQRQWLEHMKITFASATKDLFQKLRSKVVRELSLEINIGIICAADINESVCIDSITGLTSAKSGFFRGRYGNFSHPNNARLSFWNLPNDVLPIYRKHEHLRENILVKCDAVLIISNSDFTEYLWIAQILKTRKQKFYFIRQVDSTILSADQCAIDNVEMVEQIKSELGDFGKDATIFLVDTHRRHLYDFDLLLRHLVDDLPLQKREEFTLCLDIANHEATVKEAKILRKEIWLLSWQRDEHWMSDYARPIVQIPMPNSNVTIDGKLLHAANIYHAALVGMNDYSLEQTAKLWKCEVCLFKKIVRRFKNDYLPVKGFSAFVRSMFLPYVPVKFESVVREFDSAVRPPHATYFALGVTHRCIDKLAGIFLQELKAAADSCSILDGQQSTLGGQVVEEMEKTAADAAAAQVCQQKDNQVKTLESEGEITADGPLRGPLTQGD